MRSAPFHNGCARQSNCACSSLPPISIGSNHSTVDQDAVATLLSDSGGNGCCLIGTLSWNDDGDRDA